MQGKTTSERIGIEILTPVQCGSGQELFKELDYVEKNQQVFIVDQTASFNVIATGEQELDKLLTGGSQLSDLVALAGYHGYELQPMLSGANKVPDKIREHLKDAYFQPYLAGSALKGAIRTALIAEYMRSLPDNSSYKLLLPTFDERKQKPTAPKVQADDKLLDNLLGKDPKQDIFRVLHVKDAMFKTEELCLVDVRWLNLIGNANKEKAQWRSMATKRSLSDWKQADGIYVEMLKPQSQASFQLQWDKFLLSELSQWHTTTNFTLPRNFKDLKTTLNAHANYRLQQEINFYSRYGVLAPKLECLKLQKRMKDDPDSIYLQLSWGSGWRGMTGDWMSDELVEEMRQLYSLSKYNSNSGIPFPKTRRLAVTGEPKLPLGWVRLFSYAQLKQQQAARKQRDLEEIQRINSLSTLEKELEALKNIPEQEWDTRLLQKLEKAQWSSEDTKQVAEKIRQLMEKADKWHPDFTGSNKQKLKFKERSLKVLKFLND
jgi:CRISPR type III-A-associated RAMP protein Csm5